MLCAINFPRRLPPSHIPDPAGPEPRSSSTLPFASPDLHGGAAPASPEQRGMSRCMARAFLA
ncbi:Hypothetical protein CAP_6673 [Chondromyces apiculatus DSM 436]|uniref:Uncharacterized protein n=1 Tax=Chondromyces apiculatus DSM 436 TaxID=1192034 RepID=A0A017T0B0_9BACT|nr:Hypothetical protein CAP_6673 [Chondromyces apiculatus DSM 436]